MCAWIWCFHSWCAKKWQSNEVTPLQALCPKFTTPFGKKSLPDTHKVQKKNIFHPFVRTSSLFWKVTFASPFGEKSRPDTHKVWQKNPSFTLLCELVHYLGNFWSEFTFASPFGEKSRADSHKVEKTPSLTLFCELVHSLGDFLLKVTFEIGRASCRERV